jgi:hypothetical protein
MEYSLQRFVLKHREAVLPREYEARFERQIKET